MSQKIVSDLATLTQNIFLTVAFSGLKKIIFRYLSGSKKTGWDFIILDHSESAGLEQLPILPGFKASW